MLEHNMLHTKGDNHICGNYLVVGRHYKVIHRIVEAAIRRPVTKEKIKTLTIYKRNRQQPKTSA